MPNMSYCRFHNTLEDLKDCADFLKAHLSDDEHRARRELIAICRDIVANDDELDVANHNGIEDEDEEDES